MVEKRRFGRIQFGAEVSVEAGGTRYHGTLADLSMRGALVRFATPLPQQGARPWTLTIPLGEGEIFLTFQAQVAHEKDGNVGFHFIETDLETAGHLRRLLELNTGDPEQVDRELCSFGQD